MTQTLQVSVLLVDDSSFNIKLFKRYLAGQNYNLECCENGIKALELLKKDPTKYKTVLLDMIMPGMNGIEVIKKIRSDPKLKKIPVIFQTSNEDELHNGIEAGADYYIKKPFKATELQTTFDVSVKKFGQLQELYKEIAKNPEGLSLLINGLFQYQSLEQADNLSAILAQACPDPNRVILGISELLINAVEHGNLGITYDEKSELTMKGNWRAEVSKRLELDNYKGRIAKVNFTRDEQAITITIEDEGNGFDWEKYITFDPERAFEAHGRGIATAKQIIFDNLEYKGKGNIVIATINLVPETI